MTTLLSYVQSYLSVKLGCTVQEGLADVMHAVCVTRGVLQTGEGTTAHLKGTVQAASYICCGKTRWPLMPHKPPQPTYL